MANMKVIIIEDEKVAAEHLKNLLQKVDPQITVTKIINSVKSGLSWLKSNPKPDLFFIDIQLGDGLSFELIEKAKITSPIIFTTAYDKYAIKAFKTNSIDYLLKPIDFEELSNALKKYEDLSYREYQFQELIIALKSLQKEFKNRFVVKIGEHIRWVQIDEIDFFYSSEKATFIHTKDGKNFPLEFSLDQIEELVNPREFFRINRKYLVSLHCIGDIYVFSNSRLKIRIKSWEDNRILISRDKIKSFKSWLDQ